MKKMMLLLSMLILVVFSAACGSGSNQSVSNGTNEDQKLKTEGEANKDLPKVKLKFGHNAPAKSPTGRAAEKLAEIVKEKTNGNFIIEVYPDSLLGDNRDLVEQTSIGGLDMSMAGLGVLGYLADEYNLMQVPFLFRDQEHIHKVVEGEIGKQLADRLLKEKNILLLSQSWDRFPRQVTANKEIKSPDDLKNIILRSGTKAATEAFKILGAKPNDVPLNELYLSLQSGVVEAAELPPDYVLNLSVYEVNTHLNMLNHTYGTQFVAINGKKFAELPEEYQTILKEAVMEAGNYNNELTKQEESEYIKNLQEKGMKIVELTPEEHEAFAKIIQQNLQKLEELWPKSKGLGEKILNIQ